MVRSRKEYPLIEKSSGLLGKTNGALNNKMAMRAAGMVDDDANNRYLQKLVQQGCKELNEGKVPLSVNASRTKDPPPMSPLSMNSTDVSSITSHTKSSSSGIKRKHPPQTKKFGNHLLKSKRFMQTKRSKKRLIREILRRVPSQDAPFFYT